MSSLSSLFDISDISVLGSSAEQKPRKKGRGLAVISLSPSEFSNTTRLSCDRRGNRTFDWVRLAKFYCEFDYVRLNSAIERLVFDWVRLPNCSIGYVGLFTSFLDRRSSFTPLQTGSQNRWIKLDCLSFVCKEIAWMNWTCCVFLAILAGFSRATASLFFNDNRLVYATAWPWKSVSFVQNFALHAINK